MELQPLAEDLVSQLTQQKQSLTTVESCTGGLVFATMTEIAGASAVMERGFITYCNDAKQHLVGVKEATLKAHGAVSEQVAREMAIGGYDRSSEGAISVALTGIAGPGGGSEAKPVGLIYIAVADRTRCIVSRHIFDGHRSAIRTSAVKAGLTHVMKFTS